MEWVRKHKIISVIIALFIIGIFGNAVGGKANTGSSTDKSSVTEIQTTLTTQPQPTTTTTQPLPKIGQPARSGNFQFTVNSIRCGIPKVGSGFMSETAQGQYCLLDVTVENAAKTSHSFDAGRLPKN